MIWASFISSGASTNFYDEHDVLRFGACPEFVMYRHGCFLPVGLLV